MGSTRLPGKILRTFYRNHTIIDILLDNLHKIDDVKVVVATSLNSENDLLEKYLNKRGEIVYRGSENDVLERFINAAEDNGVDGIIRICSDNPFLDWHGVVQLIEKSKQSNADYIGFKINEVPSILTHFGFWGEYVTLSALKRVAATTDKGTPAHEHVTFHIYNHLDEYKCEWIKCPDYLQGRNDIRLTIDTFDDFTNAQQVYTALKENSDDIKLIDVISYIDNHENIKQSMLKMINDNKK